MAHATDLPPMTTSRNLVVAMGTALVYAAVGWLALQLAIPPSYASPMYPPAGVALAAGVVYGWPGIIGGGLGAFAVNFGLAAARGTTDPLSVVLLPAVIGLGAALQAGAGRVLVQRFVGLPLMLQAPREILKFSVLAGPVACMVNATLSTSMLVLTGVVPGSEAAETVATWWVGDALGVLIAAPIVLSLVGRPRGAWAPRRTAVALPMLVGTVLLAVAAAMIARWEQQRLRETFEHVASTTLSAVDAHLREAETAVQALHAVFDESAEPGPSTMQRGGRWWLEHSKSFQALGYAERVSRVNVPRFEARMRLEGPADYRVFDRPDGNGIASGDTDVLAIRMIEPAAGNQRALGVNVLSVPAARDAVQQAVLGGRAISTQAFRLTQASTDETGVVVYQALYRGAPKGDVERREALRGVVFVTVRVERALEQALMGNAPVMGWCLIAPGEPADRRRVAGPAGCERATPAEFSSVRPVAFAGRQWELRVQARAEDLPGGGHSSAWLFSIVGLAATASLGMLLMTVTGRARRIEQAVQDRTLALTQEVNDRRAAEAALRDSEARQRSIVDHVPIGVVFLDTHGFALEVNPRLCAMLGVPDAGMLRGRSAAEVVMPDELVAGRWMLGRLLAGDRPVLTRQTRLRRSDGSALWVRATLTVLRDAEGHAQRVVGAVEDITEHLQLLETERARDAAESSNRAKTEFVSRMSHELRTPLNAMLGFAQLLGMDRRPALAPHQHGWTTQIQHAGWHLLEMINDTLDLARIESGLVQLNLQPVELGPLVSASVALVANAAEQRAVVIEELVDARVGPAMADETRLKQVLTNLLSNAIKYNRDGGRVRVLARALDDRQIEVVVQDTGLGMTPSQLGALFQPYNRLGREASAIEGTGIGLVISRRLAELMGGSLEATSVAGQGSSFTLRLPRAAFTDSGSPIRGAPEAPPPYRRRLVHYIEDNETNVEVMRGVLAQRPQIVLEVSFNGLDGLAGVRMKRPDLILLDMHLPDIGGLELLRHLKHDDAVADIPVIVVSADATPARMEEALTLGAAHYVTKPVDIASFLQTLDQTLNDMETRWG